MKNKPSYGTPEAGAIVELIAEKLPSAIATKSDNCSIPPCNEITDYKGDGFSAYYKSFLDVECKDARPSDVDIYTKYQPLD